MGKRTTAGVAVLCAALIGGCRNNPSDTPDEFDIAFVELRVGTQAARVTSEGVVEGEITVAPGDRIASLVFVDADGDVIDFQGDDERRAEVDSGDPAVVTWTRLNNETGILMAHADGSTTLTITLEHRDHTDFGPQSIPVSVVSTPLSVASTSSGQSYDPQP